MFFRTPKLEDFLVESNDSTGARKFLRLQTNIPVLYHLEKGKDSGGQFRQCNSVDISAGGIAIEVFDIPRTVREKLLKHGTVARLRVDLPSSSGLVEFTAKVRWSKTIEQPGVTHDIIGFNFHEIHNNDRISIISYAVALNRRRIVRKYIITTALVLLALSSTWGLFNYFGRKKVARNLEVSEKNREILKGEVEALGEKKEMLASELIEATASLEKQKKELTGQNEALLILQAKLQEKATELAALETGLQQNLKRSEKLKAILESFEDRLYKYLVNAEKDDIYISDSRDLQLLKEENFKKAQAAMNDSDYNDAVYYYVEALKKHPDAKIGYSLLARALYKDKRKDSARKSFNKYLRLQYENEDKK